MHWFSCFHSHRDRPQNHAIDAFLAQVRPLDLLVFKGAEGVSNLISKAETVETGIGTVTHVEVAINKEWCEEIKINDDRLCSWGSTLSGKLNDGTINAETGHSFFGVQVRDLRDLVHNYLKTPGADVGLCRLKSNPIEQRPDESDDEYTARISKLRANICSAYDKYNNCMYNINVFSLMGAMFPKLRGLRNAALDVIDEITPAHRWLFCSEFVALLYEEIGVITDETDGVVDGKIPDASNVLPVDFVGGEADPDGIIEPICDFPPIWIKSNIEQS